MRFYFLIVASFFFNPFVRAQTLPFPSGIPLTTATISATIAYDSADDVFVYNYLVSNSKQSVGVVSAFYVDISTSAGGAVLSSADLTNSATGYSGFGSAVSLSRIVKNATVPVGFKSQPAGWNSGSTAQFTAGWFGPLPPGAPIAPGQSLGTFVLVSHGLPGIRHFTAKPRYDPADFLPGIDEVPDAIAQQVVDLDNEIQRVIQTRGYTIGPVQPPSLTDVGRLLDFVASLKHQAAALGWISGPGVEGVVQSLDAKLSAAKAALARGDAKAAEGQITAFIDELEAQRGKHLNDDAFYMLQANAQFILAKLGP